MDLQNAGNNNGVMTVDLAKSKLSIALTKQSLLTQNLQNRADALVMNEDHLDEIGAFISDTKEATKVVEETHKIIKKPFFDQGKACDTAKNDMITAIDAIALPVKSKFNQICADIDRRKREAEERVAREKSIKSGVEANILDFATKIASCKTRKELTDVERLINLEKSPSREGKYGEWHDFAKNRYDEVLIPVLKDQKIKVDEYEKLEKQKKEAEEANDPAKIDELNRKLEEKENEITQNQILVQEQALNQITSPVSEVEEIFPEVTKAGSNIVCEIVDEKIVFKKHRELLNIDLKLIDTKKLGATLRDAGAFNGNDELIFDGIKFKIERKWKT